MNVQIGMVALSHLSDAQELIQAGYIEKAESEINFVKRLLLKYPDTEMEVPQKEVDEIYLANMKV